MVPPKDNLKNILNDNYSKALFFLKKFFGYDSFRKGQKEIIESVLNRKDTLGIMPTGGGKSLCYQIPALIFENLTIVISPLISLMKDQIDFLKSINYPAEMINSTISFLEQKKIMEQVENKKIKLLYLTPERFKSDFFIDWLKNIKVDLFAIDESHCISEWGHDFRPDYRKLPNYIKILNNPQILALTATATDEVKEDIIKVLGLKNPEIIINGFNRDNLIYGVEQYHSLEEKNKGLLNFIKKVIPPGIIYVSSVKQIKDIYNYLRTNTNYNIGIYHGKLEKSEREKVQDDFLQNKINILIATNAFGMGVDKSDIRFVVHYAIPGTLESYYQETGRAGRDGKLSFCLLQYYYEDEEIQKYFINAKNPEPKKILEVYNYLLKYGDFINEEENIKINNNTLSSFEKQSILTFLDHNNCLEYDFLSEDFVEIKIIKKSNNLYLNEMLKLSDGNNYLNININYFCKKMDLSNIEFQHILKDLKNKGFINYKINSSGKKIKAIKNENIDKIIKEYETIREKKILFDYYKFKKVIDYAKLENECRRKYLLNYFGEDFSLSNCEKCDICRKTYKKNEIRLKEIDLKILTVISLNNGKFGKIKLSKILKGMYEMYTQYGDHSDFGLLKNYDIKDILNSIKYLQAINLIYTSNDKYPVLRINEAGKEMLRCSKNKITDNITKDFAIAYQVKMQ